MNARQAFATAQVTPGLALNDPGLAYWQAQVNLRLRREVAWCWYQRLGEPGAPGQLPPLTDPTVEALDQVRFQDEKPRFFAQDPAARYLSEELEALEARRPAAAEFGTWTRLAAELELGPAPQFVFALALAARLDAALGPVFATCMNDLSRPYPTLALAQRLWDEPLAVLDCADPAHPLQRYGLLSSADGDGYSLEWQRPLHVQGLTIQALLEPADLLPAGLQLVKPDHRVLDLGGEVLAQRLANQPPQRFQAVPLLGPEGADFEVWAAVLARRSGRPVAALPSGLTPERVGLTALAVVGWLRGVDLVLPDDWLTAETGHGQRVDERFGSVNSLPVRWYIPGVDRGQFDRLPAISLLPTFHIPTLEFAERAERLRDGLGHRGTRLGGAVEECARRFRLQERPLQRLLASLPPGPLDAERLLTACRNEVEGDLGSLAQPVKPRFTGSELVLPPAQQRQFSEIGRAMKALTTVHYHWGTARPWNESGLSVLFCGPPGTGKTMASEALAADLDLPLYRVDLSQVVNKYIGETEKNLRRIFDAAEQSDCILFFDEADALFGKRTAVREAHDRFANIEISYLLERMERFKGLAILATNRRKDLDEAFIRRLRYIIDFPLPGVAERERIWRQGFPLQVDVADLDFPFLAQQFQLAGGHIRSIIFNACLQSAGGASGEPPAAGKAGRVGMAELLLAVKRELEKMSRSADEAQFGNYGALLREAGP